MTNTLAYYFYCTRENFNSLTNQIHFTCLKRYKHVFDDIIICISVDDIYDTFLIKKIQIKFLNLFYVEGSKNPNISFKIYENESEYCESKFFYNEVVLKLNTYDLVFFAHNKGLTNPINDKTRENLFHWIISMYYHNLKNIKEINEILFNRYFISYGAFLLKERGRYITTKENDKPFMYYCGTFQWINGKRLHNIIHQNGIKIPELDGRHYAESFIGSLDTNRMSCVNQLFLEQDTESHMLEECTRYCKTLGYFTDGYNEEYNKIMEKINETS